MANPAAAWPRNSASPRRSKFKWAPSARPSAPPAAILCGSRPLIDYLINRARSFIFSTAPVPAAAAAAAAGVRLVAKQRGRATAQSTLGQRGRAFPSPGVQGRRHHSHFDRRRRTKRCKSRALCSSGAFSSPPFAFPTVARGQARLRLTMTAAHSRADLEQLLAALARPSNLRCTPDLTLPSLAQLDRRFVWHPFTQMRDWLKREPIVIVSGRGAVLRDARGREYLDANSSIWTNLHGHRHPAINAAITGNLAKSRTPPRWVWPTNPPPCWPPNWSAPGRLFQSERHASLASSFPTTAPPPWRRP